MKSKLLLVARLVAAGILLQTLFFKFTAAPESVYIFTTLKVEPWGRWFAGLSELVASLLLLLPATQLFGALFSLAIMLGAIMSHIFILGIVVQDDGGVLFALACFVVALNSITILSQKQQLLSFIQKGRALNA